MCTCSGSSAFFQDICPSTRDVFFSDILASPKTCITVGIFISDISDIQQLIYLCTCSRSSIFFQDICPSTRVILFLDIPDTPRTCITAGIFISYISDIQHLIYLCTCSRSSAFFQDIYLSTRINYFRIFHTFPGNVLHVWHLAPKFIGAHLADAMEVLHLSSTFIQAPRPHTVLNSLLQESQKFKLNIWEFPKFSPEHTIQKICRANIGPHNQP